MFHARNSLLAAVALSSAALSFACNEAPMSSEEIAQNQEALCANGDGVNSAMAALAVATAQELKRWQPTKDFSIDSSGRLALTAGGKALCKDGKCWNTQAVLDLQKAPLNTIRFGTVVFNADNFKSRLYAEYNEQKDCEARANSGSNCAVVDHKLTFISSQKGACDTIFTFAATTPSGGQLPSNPLQFRNKLIYVGYPENPYLAFQASGGNVSVDPTGGLNDDGNTTPGTCSAACTKMSLTDISNQCCSCAGVTKKYVRSTFNANIYLCQ
ncbi:MAG TPA: hypothetical protein VMG12_30995 [Polyangiaceae bacterium]|nr:hypothetical protein [Polyangiaceae bacterium]